MMKSLQHAAVVLGIWAMVGTPSYAACPGCTNVKKSGEGFCCGKGAAFGVELTSKKLAKALAGKVVSADKAAASSCHGCKDHAAKGGSCDKCHVAGGMKYASPVAYALAKGKVVDKEKMLYGGHGCKGCKTAMNQAGKCTGCGVGFVGARMYKLDHYDAALRAYGTLRKAAMASSKCEPCAIAMVTDGACEHCNVRFKDGKPKKGAEG